MRGVSKCPQCGAELLPEANFCRQCGESVKDGVAPNSSELPTEVLHDRVETVSTQRLDPSPTRPDRGAVENTVASRRSATAGLAASPPVRRARLRALLIVGAVLTIIIVGLMFSVAYIRIRSHSRTSDNSALLYPGAQTVLDITNQEGGRAIQLQTPDSLERVVAWYEATLKPTKTLRLTSRSVVLKNQNVTATIATEDNQTSVLIKQSATTP